MRGSARTVAMMAAIATGVAVGRVNAISHDSSTAPASPGTNPPPADAHTGTSEPRPNGEKQGPDEALATAPDAARTPRVTESKGREALEREFERTLTGAVLTGTWQMTGKGGLADKGPLTQPKPEHYTITSVAKGLDDHWVITARIQFGDKDVHVPVPVRVVWAGDTPVIALDNVAIPLIGTYSARVMIYRDFYSGAWASDAKNYGGTMAGRITRRKPPASSRPPGDKAGADSEAAPPR